jgi:hypothetical protein
LLPEVTLIPDFDANGNLPPGIHRAEWKEFSKRFGKAFLDFFQTDKNTGEPKGIVLLDLGGVK